MMAPICLFVFKRSNTTQQMLASLMRCPECKESDLYVFMDAARNDAEAEDVQKVRSLFDGLTGFRSVQTKAATTNKGLARSVIEGVSHVLQQHENIIVLEDDLVVTSDFLQFMNTALDVFHHRNNIWSISGYTPSMNIPPHYDKSSVFLVPRAQCWGWATWRDRWQMVDWDVSDYDDLRHNSEAQRRFNYGGNDLYRTLKIERKGRIESWAVRWAYAASKHDMWTVNPMESKVRNIGTTESERHGGWHDKRHDVELHDTTTIVDPDVKPDATLVRLFKKHHDLGIISKIGYFLRLHNLGYNYLKGLLNN